MEYIGYVFVMILIGVIPYILLGSLLAGLIKLEVKNIPVYLALIIMFALGCIADYIFQII